MTNEKEYITIKHITPYDFWVNNAIIRILLKIRNSKTVFSSKSDAVNALKAYDKTQQDSYCIKLNRHFRCKVTERKTAAFPVYDFWGSGECEKIVIYLHGGAFANQPISRHIKMVDEIASLSGARLIFPVYPKAPYHNFQETYDMIEAIYADVLKETKAQNVVFAGDSAGAMMCVTLMEYFKNKSYPLPGQLILLSLVADTHLQNPNIAKIDKFDPMQGTEGLKEFFKAWADDTDIYSSLINPIAVDLSILPKTIMLCGQFEIFQPDNEIFAEKAKENGVDIQLFEYRNMFHCFPLFDLICAKQARRYIAKSISNNN